MWVGNSTNSSPQCFINCYKYNTTTILYCLKVWQLPGLGQQLVHPNLSSHSTLPTLFPGLPTRRPAQKPKKFSPDQRPTIIPIHVGSQSKPHLPLDMVRVVFHKSKIRFGILNLSLIELKFDEDYLFFLWISFYVLCKYVSINFITIEK